MTETETRALKVAGMPAEAETLAMESRRQGAKLCSHCYGTRWVVMTAENEDGEYEDYTVLCRKCGA
jgi:hypothetical protein